MSNIAFLFGSGISIPAGLPNTSEITKQVISAANAVRAGNDGYYITEPQFHDNYPLTNTYVPRVKKVIEQIIAPSKTENLDVKSRTFTYEDIFFISHEILNTILMNAENAMYKPSVDFVRKEFGHLLGLLQGEEIYTWGLPDLFTETNKYIADTVRAMLWKRKSKLDHMTLLKNAYLDPSIDSLCVSTLNHDLLLETYFKDNEMPFNDGFEFCDNDLELWNSEKLFSESKLRLLKLHGSINWYSFEIKKEELSDYVVGKLGYGEFYLKENNRGIDRSPAPNHPLIIVGTDNKILEYHKYIFFDIQVQFFVRLRESSELFISGYSFGDNWINRIILDWMRNHYGAIIVIAHDDYDSLIEGINTFFTEWLKLWQNDQRLHVISKRVESVSWQEIRESFEYIKNQRSI